MLYEIQIAGRTRKLELQRRETGWQAALDGEPMAADIAIMHERALSLLVAGRSYTFAWARRPDGALCLAARGRDAIAEVLDPRRQLLQRRFEQEGRARLLAPMAGKVVRLLVQPGEAVDAGQGVVVLEAMKMQNEVRSPKRGTLAALHAAAGDTVATGQLLAEVE